MNKLSTIQKRANLNEVYTIDDKGPGGAHHLYGIQYTVWPVGQVEVINALAKIQFQKGPRNEDGSTHGVIDTDLLEIVRDRLKSFQAGPYSSRENALALTYIEEALMWLNRRVEDRLEREVLGKNAK